jgi:TRAP transporter TAXI family solute receptor
MFHFAPSFGRGAATVLTATALAFVASSAGAQIIRTDTGAAASLTTFVPQLLAKFAAEQGIKLQITSDQTLTRSAVKLGAGQIEMAVVPPPAFALMKAGKGPYEKQAEESAKLAGNLRMLFGFIGGHLQTIVWADSGMKSYADFKGKRVFIGPPGGAANAQLAGLVRVGGGLEPDKDYVPVRLGWGAATQAFQDGQMDVFITAAPAGSAEIAQLAIQRPIRIISLPEAARGKAWEEYLERNGEFEAFIEPQTYSGQVNKEERIVTAAYNMQLAVNASMDDDTAYKLTKAFWDNIDEVKASSAVLKSLDPKRPLQATNIPLHPGAAKYFKEKGITIPDNVMPVAAK